MSQEDALVCTEGRFVPDAPQRPATAIGWCIESQVGQESTQGAFNLEDLGACISAHDAELACGQALLLGGEWRLCPGQRHGLVYCRHGCASIVGRWFRAFTEGTRHNLRGCNFWELSIQIIQQAVKKQEAVTSSTCGSSCTCGTSHCPKQSPPKLPRSCCVLDNDGRPCGSRSSCGREAKRIHLTGQRPTPFSHWVVPRP